ncbi:MAG: WG repeat-containing protein [Alistipes sp.]|nr:WG repeat-containing protein [Alistipes sp.]
MKRFFAIVAVMFIAISSASAQKKVVEELVTTVEAQKSSIEAVQTEMNGLKAENATLKQQLQELNARHEQLVGNYTSLAQSYQLVATDVQTLRTTINGLATQVTALNDSIVKLSARPAAAAPAEPAKPQYEVVGKLSNNMVAVKEGFLYGFINSKNEYVVKAQYQEVKDFVNGHARVKLNDKWGMIDTNGKVTVACSYDEIEHYHGTIWRVKKGDLYGLVSAANGTLVQAVKYSKIRLKINCQRAEMCINNKSGFFDENGKIAIAAQYDWVGSFLDDGTTMVMIGSKYYDINTSGTIVKYY